MKSIYKDNIIVAVTIIAIIGILYFSDFSFTTFTGLAIFETKTQNDFSNGTYNNTEWSVNRIKLSANNLSGTYTSQIFDVGRNATWNNISWVETLSNLTLLIIVDAQSDIWKGNNSGATWTLIEDDFNNGEGNDPKVMIVDTNNSLYVIEGDGDVWQSNNLGVAWTKVNDDYNDAEGQDPKVAIADNSSNLLIIEGDADVWQSNNSGATWAKVATNFNGGNDNVKGIASIGLELYIVDAQSDIWKGNNSGSTWTLIEDDFNNGEGNDPKVMIVDTNNSLYVLEGDGDVWQSNNLGVTWTKVNDDYNGAEGQDPKVAIADNSSSLFIIEGDEDVWQSNNSGATWVKQVSNFNGGNGEAKGIISLFFATDLTFSVRSCSLSDCSDSSFSGSYTIPSKENLSIANNRYFQYKVFFTSGNTDVSSLLYNVSIDYSLIDYLPVLSSQSPENNFNSTTGNITFSCSATDDLSLDTIVLYHNINGSFIANQTSIISGNSNTSNFTINNIANGVNLTWNCLTYDNVFQSAWGQNRSINITIEQSNLQDAVGPSITLLTPLNNSVWNSSNIVTFSYNVTDSSNVSNCSLILNNEINLTATNIINITNTLERTLSNANYNWSINCTDQYNNANSSDAWLLTVNYSTSQTSNTGSSNQNTITQDETAGGRRNIQCIEEWICADWGACINGIRTRSCSDTNNCGTTNNKSNEEESCNTEIIIGESSEKPSRNPFSRLTGLVTLDNLTYFAKDNYLVFVFLFGVAVIYLNYRLNLFNRIKRKIKGRE